MKKLLLIGAFVALCVLGVGCSQQPQEEPIPPESNIGKSEEINLDLYSDYRLPDGDSAVWSSSAPATVSVQNGKLIALQVGTAEIGNQDNTRKYKITVKDNGQRPDFLCEDVQVMVGDTNVVETSLFFGGNEYSDYSVTFASDSDVISINGTTGEYEVLKAGEATVTVSAQWRNVPSVFLTKEITIKALPLPATIIAPSHTNVDLYTTNEVAGVNYKNSEIITISAMNTDQSAVDLTAANLTCTSDNPSILEIDQVDGEFSIVGKKEGKAVLTFVYTGPADAEKSVSTKVEVNVKMVTIKHESNFLTDKQDIVPQEIASLIPDFNELTDITKENGEICLYDGSEFKLNDFVTGKRVWRVSNGKYAYEFDCTVVSKVIRTEAEFLKLYDYLDITDDMDNQLITMDGYVVLGANLDFSNMAVTDYKEYIVNTKDNNRRGFGWISYAADYYNSANASTYKTVAGESGDNSILGADHKLSTSKSELAKSAGFIGTLDGNGYTIKGLRIGAFGLFPSVGTAGVIKDISLADATLTMQCFPFGGLFAGTMDNVLLDYSGAVSGAWGVGGVGRAFTGTISNTIINMLNVDATDKNSGAIAFRQINGNAWGNTYVLTDTMKYYGNGDNASYTGSLFTSVEAFNQTGSQDYTNYDKSIWDFKTCKLPVFKTYNGSNIEWNDSDLFVEKKSGDNFAVRLEGVSAVTGVTCSGTSLNYTYSNGVLTILQDSVDLLSYGNQRLIVKTNGVDVELVVTVVDKLIRTSAEFLALYNYLSISNVDNLLTFDGYIMLGTDLDFSAMSYMDYNRNYYYAKDDELKHGFGWLGYTFLKDLTGDGEVSAYTGKLSQYHGNGNVGFVGTFDGAGHTVKGLTVGPLGLFPSVGTNGVIKNVAFADLVLCKESYLFGTTLKGKLSNALIDIKKDSSSAAAGICDKLTTGTIENTVIYYPNPTDSTKYFSAIARSHTNANVINTYVICGNGVVFGDGLTETYDYMYTSIDAFNAVINDYASFDSRIWDFESHVLPVFKTYSGADIPVKS